jgi:hypothetical protein
MARALDTLLVLLTLLVPAAVLADGGPDWALNDPVEQGALVRGSCAGGCRVELDGRAVRVDRQGRFVLGFDRDHGASARLELVWRDGRRVSRRLEVRQRAWDVQRIDGLPPAQVSPSDPALLARIERERAAIRRARGQDSELDGLWAGFVWPTEGPRSGVFGSQRVLNGQPRAPHLGVDIAAPEGTPVGAAAAGIVRLAEPDLFFTGGTVIIDHGHGVGTIYAHLSRIEVAAGDSVVQGQPIGAVGRTGRATGPHLHLGLYWFDRAVDPERVLPPRTETRADPE